MVLWPVNMGNARRFRGDSMKIGTLCKVTSRTSHYPSQFGHLIVVTRGMKNDRVVTGTNLTTGKEHHYFTTEIKEVKQ